MAPGLSGRRVDIEVIPLTSHQPSFTTTLLTRGGVKDTKDRVTHFGIKVKPFKMGNILLNGVDFLRFNIFIKLNIFYIKSS